MASAAAKKSPAPKSKAAPKAAPAPKAPKAEKAPKAPAAEKPAKVERLKQNGLTRPLAGSTTGIVWDIADRLSTPGNPAQRADVLKEAIEKHGTKDATAASQYQSWRKFHGFQGRSNVQFGRRKEDIAANDAAAPAKAKRAPAAKKKATA